MSEALTRAQVEDALFTSAKMCLPDGADVRISWPEGDMPGHQAGERVCFVRVQPFSDAYTGLCEMSMGDTGAVRSYTRGHEAHYIFYGEAAMEDAEALRHGIMAQDVREALAEYKLAPFAHIAPPRRADEFIGGAWQPRFDVVIRLYEAATRAQAATAIEASPDIHLIGG